jgi:hypothetical protein
MDRPNKNRKRGFSLAIDLSGMDEKSQKMILEALAEIEGRSHKEER